MLNNINIYNKTAEYWTAYFGQHNGKNEKDLATQFPDFEAKIKQLLYYMINLKAIDKTAAVTALSNSSWDVNVAVNSII